MTNAQIIFEESQRLAEQGIIAYTGKTFNVETPDGQTIEVRETEPIHTYNAWKSIGFQVQKGQKAVAQFYIWKYTKKKVEDDEKDDEEGKMFMKKSSFFKLTQVEQIKEG